MPVTLSVVSTLSLVVHWSPKYARSVAPQVSGHATATDPEGRVLLFGGLTGSAGSPCTDDLWRYDPDDDEWTRLSTRGDEAPSPRMYAAAACMGPYFYVFGGWNSQDADAPFKEDVWRLHTSSLEWERVGRVPYGAVSRCSAATVGDCVVLHTFRGTLTRNADTTWSVVPTVGRDDTPRGLSMCSVAALDDRTLFLFGGSTQNQTMSSDAYLLDTIDMQWSRLDPVGPVPSPRALASAARVSNTSCVVFGGAGLGPDGYDGGKGLVSFDETWHAEVCAASRTVSWVRAQAEAPPVRRVAASLDRVGRDDDDGSSFLLHGGWNPETRVTFVTSHGLSMRAAEP